jgi:hypothetical protein
VTTTNEQATTDALTCLSRGGDDFVSVARRLECDEDKGRFEEKLGKIAKAKLAPKD